MSIRRRDQSSGRRIRRMSSELRAERLERQARRLRRASRILQRMHSRFLRHVLSVRTRLRVGHAVLLMSQPVSCGSLRKMTACRWRRLVEVALSSRAPRRGAASLCAALRWRRWLLCVQAMCGRERRRRGAPSPQQRQEWRSLCSQGSNQSVLGLLNDLYGAKAPSTDAVLLASAFTGR